MPPRVSRQSVPSGTGKGNAQRNKKKSSKSQKRALNAYAVAEHTASDGHGLRAHRLGHTVEDRSSKRRRVEKDDDEEAGNEEEAEHDTDRKRQRRDDEDDNSDHGSDSSGNEWRLGGPIGDESDSSLDSDEAFGSSDEERFEDFTFRGSSSKETKKKLNKKVVAEQDGDEMDLEEDQGESEEEDDFGNEGVDLATMLDHSASQSDGSGDEGDTESDADDDVRSQSSQSDVETDETNAEKISRLQDLVASLESGKTKTAGGASRDVHESQQPSDFGVTASKKLSIADLLPTVTDPALRKSLKVLASTDDGKSGKRSVGIPGRLSAPLPKRQKDRIERVVATAKAKEQLDKWQDTVIQNRRAEHLHFPLVDPNASAPAGESQLLSVGQDKPANELESAIAAIMEESGLSGGKQGEDEDKLRAAEDLQMKDIPVEEVLARRAALRRARDLLFREEIKAKRIKKIKSKSYRRVHRKERERAAERDRQMYGVDEDEENERLDRARAEERMGLKHKESKWAKSMKHSGRTVWDDDAREGVVDMARRKEELRRRIEGKDVNDDDYDGFGSEDNNDASDFDEDDDAGAVRLKKQLDRLDDDEPTAKKGIAGMAFMQRAEAARKRANDETVEEIRKSLSGETGDSDADADRDAANTIGRQVFGPKSSVAPLSVPPPKKEKAVLEEDENSSAESEADDVRITIDDSKVQGSTKATAGRSKQAAGSQGTSNPGKLNDWLSVQAPGQKAQDDWLAGKPTDRKRPKGQREKEYDPIMDKPVAKTSGTDRGQGDFIPAGSQAIESQAPIGTTGWTTIEPDTAQSDGSDHEAGNPILTKEQEQEQHRARAFAGEEVELAFDAEKQGQVVDEDDKYTSNHLPGWGSWTGDGLSKAARKAIARQKHNPLFKTKVDGVRAADRRDAKLKNVIISEAAQRRGKKYLAGQLPHEFERKEQYERSLRIPIGPEWTTKETFQRNTKPRVIVKQGIVAPLQRPLI